MTCPDCRGTGKQSGTMHVNRGNGRGEWVDLEGVHCVECDGSGEITNARADELAAAEKRRSDRIARGVSLRDEAKRLGIRPSELSDLEHARSPEWSRRYAARFMEALARKEGCK